MTDKKVAEDIILEISENLAISAAQVRSTLQLLLDDCTIPFIARYRKEATQGLDEVQIRDIRDKHEYIFALQERKAAILRSIEEQGKLSDDLKSKILSCKIRTDLEDLYLPFKPKKRTKGQIARERGLEIPASIIFSQKDNIDNIKEFAEKYIGSHEDLTTVELVLQGLNDFLSEYISELPEVRGKTRAWMFENASYRSFVKEEFKEKKTKYTDYYDFREPVKSIASHRLLALRRGEKEEILSVTFELDDSVLLGIIENVVILSSASSETSLFLKKIIRDSYTRILSTSLETEIRLETRAHAEEEAISVFSKNMRNLLLLPPIPKRVVMGIDPGMRTGSKLTVLDATGKLLEYVTVFPDHNNTSPSTKNDQAKDKLLQLITKHKVEYIAIGNGTGCREMESFVETAIKQDKTIKARFVVVNESGASVYSASDIAREEFPELDITYRGAVSIGRRLQDPLAELVKIDPKSIGVGQYQHDVNQGKLKRTLEEVVESCVNHVGVDLNTASPSLLSYVSGIGPSLGRNIVAFRNDKGEFKSRVEVLNIPGFGPKTFQQAAGFLRISDGDNILDNSAVHPESYQIVESMAQKLGITVAELVGNNANIAKIKIDDFVSSEVGLLTLQDIIKELLKPGRDPREDGVKHSYNRDVTVFEKLQEGQTVTGTVTNVTNFGAFVDIGVHQDGLIHISELSHEFITNVSDFIAVGAQINAKIISIDRERKRISLSKKALEVPSVPIKAPEKPEQKKVEYKKMVQEPRPQKSNPIKNTKNIPAPKPIATVNELLEKFKSSRI